ncbi:hypothetical protein BHE74_00033120 [Ensete ventricosum]|nr:hypothetical protein BHE74_00033120 [Ensete ventricosum]RZS09909.1 hypothetical protein BHM03_00041045 [Ensete ventricosum]
MPRITEASKPLASDETPRPQEQGGKPARSAFLWVALFVLFLNSSWAVYHFQFESLPLPLDAEQAGKRGFSEVSALEHVKYLTKLGPHPVGSDALELAVQGGSVPWAIETYAKVSKYPSGLVISQDLFHSGAIQSATDFQVYEEVGGLSGLDFAYTDATAIYHTKKKKREKKKKEKRRTYLHQFPALSVARGRRITGEIRCLRVIPSPRAGRKDRGDRGRSRQEAKESRSEGGSFFFRKGFFKLPRFLMKRLAREIGPRNGGVKVGGRQLLLLRGLLQAVAVLDDKSTREVRTRSGGVKVRGGQLLP